MVCAKRINIKPIALKSTKRRGIFKLFLQICIWFYDNLCYTLPNYTHKPLTVCAALICAAGQIIQRDAEQIGKAHQDFQLGHTCH